MTNSRGFGKRAALGTALLVGIIAAPAAAAHAVPRGGGQCHHAHRSCDWRGHDYAGTIVINGCRTVIRGDHNPRREIIRAFRRSGYHAYVRHGKVFVEYNCRRPHVRWFAEGYRTSIRWDRGCLSISLFSSRCGSCHPQGVKGNRRGPGFNRWSWSDRDYVRPWQRTRCR